MPFLLIVQKTKLQPLLPYCEFYNNGVKQKSIKDRSGPYIDFVEQKFKL